MTRAMHRRQWARRLSSRGRWSRPAPEAHRLGHPQRVLLAMIQQGIGVAFEGRPRLGQAAAGAGVVANAAHMTSWPGGSTGGGVATCTGGPPQAARCVPCYSASHPTVFSSSSGTMAADSTANHSAALPMARVRALRSCKLLLWCHETRAALWRIPSQPVLAGPSGISKIPPHVPLVVTLFGGLQLAHPVHAAPETP